MMKKLKKLELIEAPMSELEQEALDDILAGWICNSYYVGPEGKCVTNCDPFDDQYDCASSGIIGNLCKTYYYQSGGVCYNYNGPAH